MSITLSLLTDEEFLALPKTAGKQELIDGELITLPPSKHSHDELGKRIAALFETVVDRSRIWIESGYQSDIRSVTGDWGPMQVSPPAWDFIEGVILGRAVPHTTNGNIRVGVLYLRRLLRDFQGDVRLAVAAYHQGIASVRAIGVLPETQKYVDAVEAVAVNDT